MQGGVRTPHPEAPQIRRGSVREDLIDLQSVAVRVLKFGYRFASLALTPVAGILRQLGLTNGLCLMVSAPGAFSIVAQFSSSPLVLESKMALPGAKQAG